MQWCKVICVRAGIARSSTRDNSRGTVTIPPTVSRHSLKSDRARCAYSAPSGGRPSTRKNPTSAIEYPCRDVTWCKRNRCTGVVTPPRICWTRSGWRRELRRQDVQHADRDESREPDADGNALHPVLAMDDPGHVPRKILDRDQRDVPDGEQGDRHEREEVEASRRLAAAEEAQVPRESCRHGGRHAGAVRDERRSQHEDDRGVRELLERIVGMA